MADAKKLEVFAKLTPLDIRGKAVKRTMRGFIGADVNASLEELAEELKMPTSGEHRPGQALRGDGGEARAVRQLEQTLEARWSLPSAAPGARGNGPKEAQLVTWPSWSRASTLGYRLTEMPSWVAILIHVTPGYRPRGNAESRPNRGSTVPPAPTRGEG